MKIGVVTDSVADVPKSIVEKYNIQVIPSIVIIGGEEYLDGIDISREEFYDRLPHLLPPPTTAAPPPAEFSKVYQRMFEGGYTHLISIHTAPQLSLIHNAALLAAEGFPGKINVINSTSLTMGVGLQVLVAAEAIEAGAALPEILQSIESTRARMKLFAMLDTLEQLKRSGRVSWLKASVGGLLKIRLFVELKDGDVLRHSQVRTRTKAIQGLAELIKAQGPIERIAMLHSNAEADAHTVFDMLDLPASIEPYYVNITPGIGTHVGAQALGFVVIKKA